MSFIYSDTEAEIVTRLQAKITGDGVDYTFIPMPKSENEYDIGDSGVLVVVAFLDSSFDPPDGLGFIKQKEKVKFICNILSRNLRGANSIHEAIRLLKKSLVGYRLQDMSSKLYLQSIEYDIRDEENNFFSYNIVFAAEKLHVEEPDVQQDGPLLREVFWREQINITTDANG